jgi:hypothetical protein
VTTPARIAAALAAGWLAPAQLAAALKVLVLDEADLLLSYGYSEDLQALAVHIPRSTQCLLMSATSSAEVEQLQQLILHNPITLNLLTAPQQQLGDPAGGAAAPGAAAAAGGGEPAVAAAAAAAGELGAGGAGSAAEIVHFAYGCSKEDRRLVVLSLLKLGLLKRKASGAAGAGAAGVARCCAAGDAWRAAVGGRLHMPSPHSAPSTCPRDSLSHTPPPHPPPLPLRRTRTHVTHTSHTRHTRVTQVLIFANRVEDGVALRLFLESFGLRLGCLHAELPVNSRSHMLAAFNKGLFDYLIAVGASCCDIACVRAGCMGMLSRVMCAWRATAACSACGSDTECSPQHVCGCCRACLLTALRCAAQTTCMRAAALQQLQRQQQALPRQQWGAAASASAGSRSSSSSCSSSSARRRRLAGSPRTRSLV